MIHHVPNLNHDLTSVTQETKLLHASTNQTKYSSLGQVPEERATGAKETKMSAAAALRATQLSSVEGATKPKT